MLPLSSTYELFKTDRVLADSNGLLLLQGKGTEKGTANWTTIIRNKIGLSPFPVSDQHEHLFTNICVAGPKQ